VLRLCSHMLILPDSDWPCGCVPWPCGCVPWPCNCVSWPWGCGPWPNDCGPGPVVVVPGPVAAVLGLVIADLGPCIEALMQAHVNKYVYTCRHRFTHACWHCNLRTLSHVWAHPLLRMTRMIRITRITRTKPSVKDYKDKAFSQTVRLFIRRLIISVMRPRRMPATLKCAHTHILTYSHAHKCTQTGNISGQQAHERALAHAQMAHLAYAHPGAQ